MVHFLGEEVNEEARILIEEIKVGGIIYYNWANGLHSKEQVTSLSLGLQAMAKIPLLIAADQEGGIVNRLTQGFTIFPGNKALAMTGDPNLAKLSAFAMGREMLSAGVNMNLAPVVDINVNPKNPVIGLRSFGEDAETVVRFAKEALVGFGDAGVITTLKHFPGHGDVSIDSHESLPVVNKPLEVLERVELRPFRDLGALADAIMTAHILVPALDKERCSTVSKKTLSYLREEMGFEGVIISDSLIMDALLEKYSSIDEASIEALNAGCDILLLGGKLLLGSHAGFELRVEDIRRIHAAIVEGARSGRVSEERIDRAVERILHLKSKIKDRKLTFERGSHQALAKEIAEKALQVTQRESVSFGKVVVIAPDVLKKSLPGGFFFQGLNPSKKEIKEALLLTQDADLVVVFSYNAWKNPSQQELILSIKKPFIVVVARDGLDHSLFANASTIFNTFSPSTPSLEAACDYIGF